MSATLLCTSSFSETSITRLIEECSIFHLLFYLKLWVYPAVRFYDEKFARDLSDFILF